MTPREAMFLYHGLLMGCAALNSEPPPPLKAILNELVEKGSDDLRLLIENEIKATVVDIWDRTDW